MTPKPKDNPFSGSTQYSPSMCHQILILCLLSGTLTRLDLVTFSQVSWAFFPWALPQGRSLPSTSIKAPNPKGECKSLGSLRLSFPDSKKNSAGTNSLHTFPCPTQSLAHSDTTNGSFLLLPGISKVSFLADYIHILENWVSGVMAVGTAPLTGANKISLDREKSSFPVCLRPAQLRGVARVHSQRHQAKVGDQALSLGPPGRVSLNE